MRIHIVIVPLLLTLLSACADGSKGLDGPVVPLGDFSLGHNVVVADKAQMAPISRPATKEELETAMRNAIDQRFGRYEGPSLYHFGISIEGYSLAPPGVPVVFSPKSALIIYLTVWDDAAGKKLNDKPKQVVVLETFGTKTLVGSGYTLSAEEQLVELTRNAAKAVEDFLVEQQESEGWFAPDEAAPQDGTADEAGETAVEDSDPAVTSG